MKYRVLHKYLKLFILYVEVIENHDTLYIVKIF